MNEHPVRAIHRLRDDLGAALHKKQWKRAGNRARSLLKAIPLMLEQREAEFGRPTLDGVYAVGTMTYIYAHKKTRTAIERFNQTLRESKALLAKKQKKKKR